MGTHSIGESSGARVRPELLQCIGIPVFHKGTSHFNVVPPLRRRSIPDYLCGYEEQPLAVYQFGPLTVARSGTE